MPHSIYYYVDVTATLGGTGVAAAGFGTPALIFESAVESGSRVHGPFSSAAALVTFGYTSGSVPHLWAQAVFSQPQRVSEVYVIRRDAGDADDAAAFDAAVAENPSAFYCVNSALRDSTEILALAAAVEASTYPKIAVLQCNDASMVDGVGPSWSQTLAGMIADGDFDLIFTGFGLVTPQTVTITRSGSSPSTLADIQTAMAAELDTQTDVAGDIEGVIVAATIDATDETISFTITDGLPTGTVTATLPGGVTGTPTETDADVASRMFDLQYARSALAYYHDDAVRMDGAWTSVGLSYDLDVKKGIWAFKPLNGVAESSLSDLQVTSLRATNTNYFAKAIQSSGVETRAFTAQGWMPSGEAGAGQRIDVTITLDWRRARIEEAISSVLLSQTHGVVYDDAGINQFRTAVQRVLQTGVDAGHFVNYVVPDDDPNFPGLSTPAVIVPKAADVPRSTQQTRVLTFSAVVYLAQYIEGVVFNISVEQ